MLVGKSPWLASQWLFRSPGNRVSSTAATSTWFHARRDKHSSAGPACLADTHYAYLSRWPSGQFGLLRFRLHCRRPHPPPSIRNPVNNTMPLKCLWRGCLFTGPPLEGFSEQEATLRGIVAALPVHWFRFTIENQPFLFTLENQPLKPFLQEGC